MALCFSKQIILQSVLKRGEIEIVAVHYYAKMEAKSKKISDSDND